MIGDFDYPEEDVGFLVGALTASFMFCQFICSPLWGWYSDLHGRRMALIIGQVFGAAAIIFFGCSTNYAMAISARCVGGIMNGNIGVIKAYIADISDATNRGFSFSIIAIGWGAGSILGATIGGLLVISYELEEDGGHKKSESVLPYGPFKTFPYLLPCVIGCIMAVNAIIFTILFVKNEAGSFAKTRELRNKEKNEKNNTKWSMSNGSFSKKYSHHEMRSIDYNSSGYLSKSLPSVAKPKDSEDMTQSQYSADDSFYSPKRRATTRNYSLLEYEAAYTIDATLNDTIRFRELLDFSKDKKALLGNDQESDDIEINSIKDLFTKTYLARTIFVIMTYALFSMLWNQLAPIFVAQSLDFNSTQTGIMMAFGSFCLSIFTFFIQPYFLKRYRYKLLSIVSTFCLWFVVLGMPTVSLLKNDNENNFYLLLGCVCVLHGAKYAFASILFVTTLCYMNNSVPPEHCGRVNGIGQSFSALMRGVGPLSGGFIWSWSMSLDGEFERFKAYPAYLFTFLFLFLTGIVIWCLIDDSMQIPWEDKMAKKYEQQKNKMNKISVDNEEEDEFEDTGSKRSKTDKRDDNL